MNAVQRSNRLAQIEGQIRRLEALKGQHEVRMQFIPRGVSEPALYRDGQRAIIAGIDEQIGDLESQRAALTQQGEFFPI